MLTAIGVIIILKQLPHAVGYDKVNEADFFFIEKGEGHNTFSSLIDAINFSHPGAILITLVSLIILIAFNKIDFLKKIKVIPGALVAVIAGILMNEAFKASGSPLEVRQEHLVNLPISKSFSEFVGQFSRPDFSSIANPKVWVTALTIAIVASIETLLCIEAADKMDPVKRYSDTNRELFAQGVGNIISGILGGLPMTSVIVRTSANVNSGGRTRTATITHGILLLGCVILIPSLLNKIPLACLAAILLMIGYKLASPKVFKHMWAGGRYQFVPFIATVVAVVFTDLLKGVGIGLIVSIFYILLANLRLAYFFKKEAYHKGDIITMKLAQEVSFLNKAAIKQTFFDLPRGSELVIDATDTFYIDYDVIELIRDFMKVGSIDRDIKVSLVGFKDEYNMAASNHLSFHTN
jgi:MFS superfamily sulfate permease-like transporter